MLWVGPKKLDQVVKEFLCRHFLLYKGNFLLFSTIGSNFASFHILVSLPNNFPFIWSLLWKRLNLFDTTTQTLFLYTFHTVVPAFIIKRAKAFLYKVPKMTVHIHFVYFRIGQCAFSVSHTSIKDNFKLDMLPSHTGQPVPFTGRFNKIGLELLKTSLAYLDFWVVLVEIKVSFCLCLFQDMFCMFSPYFFTHTFSTLVCIPPVGQLAENVQKI